MSNTSKKLKSKCEQLLQSIAKQTDVEVCKKLILKVLPLNPEPWRLILAIPVCDEIVSFTHDELLIKDGSEDYEIFLLAMKDENKVADFQISDTKRLELVLYILAKFGYTETLESISEEVITDALINSSHVIDLVRYGQMKVLQRLHGQRLANLDVCLIVSEKDNICAALKNGHEDCAEFLFDAYYKLMENNRAKDAGNKKLLLYRLLQHAVLSDDPILIKYLIERKSVDPNFFIKDDMVVQALTLALNKVNVASALTLLEHGASLYNALMQLPNKESTSRKVSSSCFYLWATGVVEIDELVKIKEAFYYTTPESAQTVSWNPRVSAGLEKIIEAIKKFYNPVIDKGSYDPGVTNSFDSMDWSNVNFTLLPTEILSLIYQNLYEPSLQCQINKAMWQFAFDDHLWGLIFKRHFGFKVNIKFSENITAYKRFTQINYLRLFKFFSNYSELRSVMSHVVEPNSNIDSNDTQTLGLPFGNYVYDILSGFSDENNNFYLKVIPHAITESIAWLDIEFFRVLAFFVDINKLAERIVQHATTLEAKDINWLLDQLSNIGLKLTPVLIHATFKYYNLSVLKWLVKHLDEDLDAIKCLYEQDADEIEFIPYELMSNALRSQLKPEAKLQYLQYLTEELGFYPHATSKEGRNLLFDVNPEEPMIMRYLLSWGLNTNLRENNDGQTALLEQCHKIQLKLQSNPYGASAYNCTRVILELLLSGADPYKNNNFGMTAYQYISNSYIDGRALIGLITAELMTNRLFLQSINISYSTNHLVKRSLDLLVGAILNRGRFYQRDGINILITLRKNVVSKKLLKIVRKNLLNAFFDNLKKHITQILIRMPDRPIKQEFKFHSFNVMAGFIRNEMKQLTPFGNNNANFLKTLCHALLIRYADRIGHIRQILKLLYENYGINLAGKSKSRYTLFNSRRNLAPKLPLDARFLLIMSQITLYRIIKSHRITITDNDLALKSLIEFRYDAEADVEDLGIDVMLYFIKGALQAVDDAQRLSAAEREVDKLWHTMLLTLAKSYDDTALEVTIENIFPRDDDMSEAHVGNFELN